MKTQAILRTAFLAICMASAFTIKAQPEAGTFSLIPKAGISSASLTNVPVILVEDPDITIKRSFFPGFYVGADFDYQVSDRMAVSAGLGYSFQGCTWRDYESPKVEIRDFKIKLGYLHLPLTASFYAFDDFAIHTGFQFSYLTHAKMQGSIYDHTFFDPLKDKTPAKIDEDIHDNLHHLDVSIPIAVSYEFDNNLIISAQYNVGITKINKKSFLVTEDMRNRAVMLTVGYKFALNP